jgi:hypothetical protein
MPGAPPRGALVRFNGTIPGILAAAAAAWCAGSLDARAQGSESPVELGQVAWQRDLDRALADSKQSGRPVFLFFQEVPG